MRKAKVDKSLYELAVKMTVKLDGEIIDLKKRIEKLHQGLADAVNENANLHIRIRQLEIISR